MSEKIALKDMPEAEHLKNKPNTIMDTTEEETHDTFEGARERMLDTRAHDLGALICGEGIHHIASFEEYAEDMLRRVVEKARVTYPRFDGWIILNKQQVMDLLADKVLNEESARRENTTVPVNLPTDALQSLHTTSTATFCELLCRGDEKELFTFLRTVEERGSEDERTFLKDAIFILDRIHKHRITGSDYVDRAVLEETNCFSEEDIEHIIAILVGGLDYRYQNQKLSMKISLMRALEYIKQHRTSSS